MKPNKKMAPVKRALGECYLLVERMTWDKGDTPRFNARFMFGQQPSMHEVFGAEMVIHLETGKCIKNRYGKIYKVGYLKGLK